MTTTSDKPIFARFGMIGAPGMTRLGRLANRWLSVVILPKAPWGCVLGGAAGALRLRANRGQKKPAGRPVPQA